MQRLINVSESKLNNAGCQQQQKQRFCVTTIGRSKIRLKYVDAELLAGFLYKMLYALVTF